MQIKSIEQYLLLLSCGAVYYMLYKVFVPLGDQESDHIGLRKSCDVPCVFYMISFVIANQRKSVTE